MKRIALHLLFLTPMLLSAQDRVVTPEQMKAVASGGEIAEPPRPGNMPDLTKGEDLGELVKAYQWNLGPTGLFGYLVGGYGGDQIFIQQVLPGSPADGIMLRGDVILGLNGEPFTRGENMAMLIAKAIIEAEKEENGGSLRLMVWRDLNYIKRNSARDVAGIDLEQLFGEVDKDAGLYEWQDEEEKTQSVRQMGFDRFPLEPVEMEIELTLRVLPPYSDTSPYDCPKAAFILEEAWKVLEQKFIVDPKNKRSGRGDTWAAVALAASGKPEHRKLLREWVRSPRGRTWHPPTEEDDRYRLPSKSWNMSFTGLDCALYYDATGDEFVLPALRRFALRTARGQSGGGSWGHNWAQPSFNGGFYNGMNPGYGALNTSGNRCFFLIALAQQLGIDEPEINRAIHRSSERFGSYTDLGAVPYGDHSAAASDDSNGKNSGIAYAFKVLGDKHKAKYFAQMSAHASFTRRGGHASDWFWHWTPLSANLAGPETTQVTMRNMRWWRTLCRRHDGSFVIHSPTGSYKFNRDATASFVMHYAAPLQQTLITGKDPDKDLWTTEEEMHQLLTSGRSQLNDSVLIERSGPLWKERSTDEVFRLLNIFKPKARGFYAKELGRRYQAGEEEILPRLLALLESDDPRFRDGAAQALLACGGDTALAHQSKLIPLLDDSHEFVRVGALRTLSKITRDRQADEALLKATVKEFPDMHVAPNSFRYHVQNVLFGGRDPLAVTPFESGYDEDLVQAALENLMDLDPMGGFIGSRQNVWKKDTVLRVAGPLVDAAANGQLNDQMFRRKADSSRALLAPYGYRELLEATAERLLKWSELPRAVRLQVGYKHALVDVDTLMAQPGQYRRFIDRMKTWVADKPVEKIEVRRGEDREYYDVEKLVNILQQASDAAPGPSLAAEVDAWFRQRVGQGSAEEQVRACRELLANPHRKLSYRQTSALSLLVELLEDKAIPDLIPYVGHSEWRVREHARQLATDLSGDRVTSALVEAVDEADAATAAGLLAVLRERGDAKGVAAAQAGLTHTDSSVRAEAVRTLAALQPQKAISTVQAFLDADHESNEELEACETALLHVAEDADQRDAVQQACISGLKGSTGAEQGVYAHVLSRLGGRVALAALDTAAKNAGPAEDFDRLVNALTYSPDRGADQVLVGLMKTYPDRLEQIASQATRRLVIGPDGICEVSDSDKMNFAEPVLRMVLDDTLMTYLAKVHTGRSILTLQDCMRRGATRVAPMSIIAAAEEMEQAPEQDRKMAADGLRDVIEFIEVTQLRGGPEGKDFREYPVWKTASERAGRILLKVYQPEKAPVPQFNDLDLDL